MADFLPERFPGERRIARHPFSTLAQATKDPSWCWASAVCARKRRLRPAMSPRRHSGSSDDQITHFRCAIPVPAII